MTINDYLRAIAGFFILLSIALGYWIHPGFFLFTAFVGFNLLQSAFTKKCPMISILRAAGVPDLSLIHISEPTRPVGISRMPSSA